MNTTALYFPPINKLGNVSFRRLVKSAGADYVFTEMVRVEKILEEDDDHQLEKLRIPKEMMSYTIVQIICDDISLIEKGVDKIMSIHPNVKEINYNMGCPQSNMAKNECGGGIVGNKEKVKQVAMHLAKGCLKYEVIPSIKIRLGITREDLTIYDNAKNILDSGIKKLYVHGRCLRDTYHKPATWEEIAMLKKEMGNTMEIIVNGDIIDSKTFESVCSLANFDGVLVGRAALEDPFIFSEIKEHFKRNDSGNELKSRKKALLALLEFGKIDCVELSKIKQNIMYLTKRCVGGSEFRFFLNNTHSYEEIINYIENL